jgi:hypothetical protein
LFGDARFFASLIESLFEFPTRFDFGGHLLFDDCHLLAQSAFNVSQAVEFRGQINSKAGGLFGLTTSLIESSG